MKLFLIVLLHQLLKHTIMRNILIISLLSLSNLIFSQTALLTEYFEDGFPSGWTQYGDDLWEIRTGEENGGPNYSYSGSGNASLFNYDSGTKTKLVTPAIDFSSYSNGRLEFYQVNKKYNNNYDDLKVYYSTNSNTGPWTEIAYLLQSEEYKLQMIDLPNVNSSYYIAFESENWQAYGICLDDIKVFGTNEPASASSGYCNASTVNGPVGTIAITGFMFNEIYLQSDANGYTNNYSHLDEHTFGQANIIAGQRHHFQYVNANVNTTNIEMMTVWIDYNGDGDFNDAGEKVDEQYWGNQISNAKARYFYVPENAKIGKTRVRIRTINHNNSAIDPCYSYDYGQTFDFDVFIHPPMGPYAAIPDNNTITAMGENLYIAAVKLGNIQNTSEYFGTSGTGSGSGVGYNYSNFMGQYSTTLEEGETYTIDLDISYPSTWNYSTGVWIDWNNDGDFDDSNELIGKMTTGNSVYTFTVPSGLPAYNKFVALRARVIEDNSSGSYIASATAVSSPPSSESETEDYKIYLAKKDYILPVEWLSFDASKRNSNTLLEWTTASETNNSYFVVEHSADAKHFVEIDRAEAAGNSNTITTYDIKHNNPIQGNNYYRIKQIDYDGKYSYSEIRNVYFGTLTQIRIYPNPAHDFIKIEGIDEDFILKIKNTNSKIVLVSTDKQIDISDLPKGVYLLELTTHNSTQSYKWVVI